MRSGFVVLALCTLTVGGCSSSAHQATDTTRFDSVAGAAGGSSIAADTAAASSRDTMGADALAWTVDAHGIGRVRVGETLAALSKALGEPLHAAYSYNETCDYVRPRALPAGVKLMVTGDTVVRVDVDSAGVSTREGAAVGTPETRLLTMYRGRATVQPHPYTGPGGHAVIVSPPKDSMYRMIFETDGKVVTRFRAGRGPQVDFKEGCS